MKKEKADIIAWQLIAVTEDNVEHNIAEVPNWVSAVVDEFLNTLDLETTKLQMLEHERNQLLFRRANPEIAGWDTMDEMLLENINKEIEALEGEEE